MQNPINLVFKSSKNYLLKNASKCYSSNMNTVTCNAKKRICIVGAGPAGFYAAQYILKNLKDCEIDMIEKLPVPFGLVRFGVAPDHPEVKNVINTFTKTAEHPQFRFCGNLSLGRDFSLQQLRERYHAVLLTYGADRDRRLNIPNEDQNNVVSARKLVAWYNGFPGAEQLEPDLSGRTVTIVGQGNVAVDVARILLSPIDVLRKTDITEYALEALARSRVDRVHLVGRRGPLQAAFTIKELREMLKLPNVQTVWNATDFRGIREVVPDLARPRKRITELMLKSLDEQSVQSGNKQFVPIFLRAPLSVDAQSLKCSVTELRNESAIPTLQTVELESDLILRSIGYQSTCVDNSICFDESRGHVFNNNGRVLSSMESNIIDKGLYVAGWLGTGPTGVILSTMSNAFAVAKTICDDISSKAIDTTEPLPGLTLKDLRVVNWEGWQAIDNTEVQSGLSVGKPREKIVDVEKLLKIAGV